MAPVLLLLIALVFTHHYDSLPKKVRGLFIVPVLTNIMIWTNPLHHLHYKHFSVIASEVVFGPYMYISGGYSYLCMIRQRSASSCTLPLKATTVCICSRPSCSP